MGRISPNPFSDDVFVDHAENLPGVEQIHRDAVSTLVDAAKSIADPKAGLSPFASAGRTFLLTAPRAGYGKSHLVARMRESVSEIASTLTLPFQPAKPISWSGALDSILLQATRHSSGPDLLTEIGRNFLTIMVRSALESGVVESEHFPADRGRLANGDLEIFSKQSPDNVVDWTNERSEHLAHSLGDSNTSPTDSRGADAHFWARLFLDRELGDRRAFERAIALPEDDARRRCLQILRISASLRPVVIVVDGLDAFFSSESAGLEIATILAAIRDDVPRSLTVVCLNEEIWDSVFGDKLPSAFFDRLTGEKTKLDPIGVEAARELVAQRLARIELPGDAAKKFTTRLSETNGWSDATKNLTPRTVLRQARELWDKQGADFLKADARSPDSEIDDVYDKPLSELTDKPDFFAALKEKGLAAKKKKTAPPVQEIEEEPATFEPIEEEPVPENPFFAAPTASEPEHEKLDGIESIIRDIRGSGSSVVSEMHKGGPTGTRPIPTIKAGPIAVTPARNGSSTRTASNSAHSSTDEAPEEVTKKSIGRQIQDNHRELLTGPSLTLDLQRLGKFLKAVGQNHPGLSQTLEHLPGAQTECLRWVVRGQSVILGFESPKNVYFWNHLLQQSLASNKREKISAFSHSSQVFDSDLFSTFGFSPAVIRGRIDPIEMSDEELALLYAADSVLDEYRGSGDEAMAMQFITQQLDPLWRRIGQAV